MLINKCDRMLKMLLSNLIIVILLNGITKQVLCEALRERIPLVRLPSNTLLKYTSYKDVSILHFDVPADTRTAYFNFKAYEEAKSAFRKYFINQSICIYTIHFSSSLLNSITIKFPSNCTIFR